MNFYFLIKYQTINGSCNNINEPKWGMAMTPLLRIFTNAYEDGLMTPRKYSKICGKELPYARKVSMGSVANTLYDASFNNLVMAFGQFLDHDLDHVPIERKFRKKSLLGYRTQLGSWMHYPIEKYQRTYHLT